MLREDLSDCYYAYTVGLFLSKPSSFAQVLYFGQIFVSSKKQATTEIHVGPLIGYSPLSMSCDISMVMVCREWQEYFFFY